MSNPKDLDEAVMEVLTILEFPSLDMQNIVNWHHTLGAHLRNEWFLWWYEDHDIPSWPKEKPELVKWFNDRDIYHADDMSGIILQNVQCICRGEKFDLQRMISRYKKHWKQQGFKDGIPKK